MPIKNQDEGKVYVTNYKGKLFFAKLIKIKGTVYQTGTFKFLTGSEITPYEETRKLEDGTMLPALSKQEIATLDCPEAIDLWNHLDWKTYVWDDSGNFIVDLSQPFELKFVKGIFRTGCYQGKKYSLTEFTNTRDTYIDRNVVRLFEEYPYSGWLDWDLKENHSISPRKPFILFREVDRVADFSQESLSIDNLLANLYEIRSYMAKPYAFKPHFCEGKYTNRGGIEYDKIDIFNFIFDRLTRYYDGIASRTSIFQIFNSYYQEYDDSFFHQGFSQEELLDFMEEYFNYSVIEDKYFIWDTKEEINDGIFFFDRKFFQLFYQAVKRNRFAPIHSLEGLEIKGRKGGTESYFQRYGLDPKEISMLNEKARKASSEQDFIHTVYSHYRTAEDPEIKELADKTMMELE